MLDYAAIKVLAKRLKRPVTELLALTTSNDPFAVGISHRVRDAEWFANLWGTHGAHGAHIRRLHYVLVSLPDGSRILLPDGSEYENTHNDWVFLCSASLGARYLDLIPTGAIVDQRNDEPMFFAAQTRSDGIVSAGVGKSSTYLTKPEMPNLPFYYLGGFDSAGQDFIVEIWVEKSTQNDWLVPLCQRRGVNLLVGAGEFSETRCRQLAMRSAESGVPVRVLYLSDFDPGGRSMPVAVAVKVQFAIEKLGLDVDLQLIPVALTPGQCREYGLPRSPIKETEKRKSKFEEIFGIGATELDAMEALHPGELRRLLNAEIDNYLDRSLDGRVQAAQSDQWRRLHDIEREILNRHTVEIDEMRERFDQIVADLDDWEDEADELWQTIAKEMRKNRPDLSDVGIPYSNAPGETSSFVLFDSKRSYLDQMGFYNTWRDGAEDDAQKIG